MPRAVAGLAFASGVVVVVFGTFLAFSGPQEGGVKPPNVTLQPFADTDKLTTVTDKGVSGRVVLTSGDPMPAVDVTLVPLFVEKAVDLLHTTTDADGRFTFRDVEINPGSPWVAEATFDDERFPSEVLRAPRGEKDPLELVVAQTTKKDGAIEVKLESLAVVGDRSGAQAVHAMTVVNHGKRAYVGGLRLPLLKGATAIQEGAGLDRRYLELEHGGMTSTAPILPGSHDLTYTYIVQMSRGGIRLDRKTTLRTDRYELLVGEGLGLDAPEGLRDDGAVKLGPTGERRTYARFAARHLEKGDRLRGTLAVWSGSKTPRIVIPVIAVVLALLLIGVPLLRRGRRRAPSEPAPEPSSSSVA